MQTEERILPHDDIEQVITSKSTLAIAPCYCRYTALIKEGVKDYPTFADFATAQFEDYFSPLCNLRVETCLMMGDEAEFWVEQGWARYITQEQAINYMHRSVDDGFILQSCFTKGSETICSCHADTCGIISFWNSVGGPSEQAATPAYKQISHYTLDVDFNACVKCGTCAKRCPLHITVICNKCGFVFPLDVQDSKTQECHQCQACKDYRLYSGREFFIESIEIEASSPLSVERNFHASP